MGIGDDIMATGMARGAKARGKRIAFGDGKRIIWGPYSAKIFYGNPNIAAPGQEPAPDIEWIHYYKGNRIYNRHNGDRWVWNYEFRAIPGEIFFHEPINRERDDVVVIEPNVPRTKSVAANKQWPVDRYQSVANALIADGWHVVQPIYGSGLVKLSGVDFVPTATFRDALKLLKTARLFIGPEGGLHHGAAAMQLPAVVLFGGFIPPKVTGYDFHANLTGGAQACGSLFACPHCHAAMQAISVEEVEAEAQRLLNGKI
jgi:hypothetical protein